jgi:hypothetical protein
MESSQPMEESLAATVSASIEEDLSAALTLVSNELPLERERALSSIEEILSSYGGDKGPQPSKDIQSALFPHLRRFELI